MRLLLAEDELELSQAVTAILEHSGYEVDAALDGAAALALAQSKPYDCIILDIMMPKMDGIQVLQNLRAGGDHTPVIMLTAKAEVEDRIEGLDSGADDYVTKPFAMKELLARIRSATRRSSDYTPSQLVMGSVTLNVEEHELASSNSIRLAGRESRLMEILMLNQGKSLTTEDLFTRVWSDDPEAEADIVWVYISYLRQKLRSIRADVEIAGEKDGAFTLRLIEE